MEIMNKIDKVKGKLNDLIKKHKYKKANKERRHEAELTLDVVNCAGDLGACKKEYEWIIRDQSRMILKGRQDGYDVRVQEAQLLDASVGYLLVNEALFVLQSVATYDGIVRAYELLDTATKKITGEKTFPFSGHKRKNPERSEYEFLNSEQMMQEKRAMATDFQEELIATGNIDKCIEEARKKKIAEQHAKVVPSYDMTQMSVEMQGTGVKLSEDDMKLFRQRANNTVTGMDSPHSGNFADKNDNDDDNGEGA